MFKVHKLKKWLQNYANENHCYIGINSDYSPCVCAFWEKPRLKYDEEDGYWYWACPTKKTRFKWLDYEIPEKLKWARFVPTLKKRLFKCEI